MAPVRSNHLVLMLVLCLEVSTTESALSQEILRSSSGDRDQLSDPSHAIEITEKIEFHPPRTKMSSICRAAHKVHGCTDFPAEQLSCNCIPVEGGWMITAVATIEAVVHLSDSNTLMHERQHLEDLRDSLSRHLSTTAGAVYSDERICRTKAKVMSSPSYLRDVMNKARAESNRKFRCTRDAAGNNQRGR